MVDSVTANVSAQTLNAVKRAQQSVEKQQQSSVQGAGDSVKISSEAAELIRAGQDAQAVRAQLEGNASVTLGLDPNFDTRV